MTLLYIMAQYHAPQPKFWWFGFSDTMHSSLNFGDLVSLIPCWQFASLHRSTFILLHLHSLCYILWHSEHTGVFISVRSLSLEYKLIAERWKTAGQRQGAAWQRATQRWPTRRRPTRRWPTQRWQQRAAQRWPTQQRQRWAAQRCCTTSAMAGTMTARGSKSRGQPCLPTPPSNTHRLLAVTLHPQSQILSGANARPYLLFSLGADFAFKLLFVFV